MFTSKIQRALRYEPEQQELKDRHLYGSVRKLVNKEHSGAQKQKTIINTSTKQAWLKRATNYPKKTLSTTFESKKCNYVYCLIMQQYNQCGARFQYRLNNPKTSNINFHSLPQRHLPPFQWEHFDFLHFFFLQVTATVFPQAITEQLPIQLSMYVAKRADTCQHLK